MKSRKDIAYRFGWSYPETISEDKWREIYHITMKEYDKMAKIVPRFKTAEDYLEWHLRNCCKKEKMRMLKDEMRGHKHPLLDFFYDRTVVADVLDALWRNFSRKRVREQIMVLSAIKNDDGEDTIIVSNPFEGEDVYYVNIKQLLDGKEEGLFFKAYYSFPTMKQMKYDYIAGLSSRLSLADFYEEAK